MKKEIAKKKFTTNVKPIAPKEEIINETKNEEEKESLLTVPEIPAKEKLEPLQPGQKYFEAPTGEIIIGEATKQQVWFRKLNNGRGGWINPKR